MFFLLKTKHMSKFWLTFNQPLTHFVTLPILSSDCNFLQIMETFGRNLAFYLSIIRLGFFCWVVRMTSLAYVEHLTILRNRTHCDGFFCCFFGTFRNSWWCWENCAKFWRRQNACRCIWTHSKAAKVILTHPNRSKHIQKRPKCANMRRTHKNTPNNRKFLNKNDHIQTHLNTSEHPNASKLILTQTKNIQKE